MVLGKDEKIIVDVITQLGGSHSVFNAVKDKEQEDFYENKLPAEFDKGETCENHWVILKETQGI
jgi:hypothetical protein